MMNARQMHNVWARIRGEAIIGPCFIDGMLKSRIYLKMLENIIDFLITEQLENQHEVERNLILTEDELFFQQDEDTPDYAVNVRHIASRVTEFDFLRFLFGALSKVLGLQNIVC